jgi:DNA-binding transcriptional MocR family regulator
MQTSRSLQAARPSYIREILRAATAEGVISLAGGLPATELLPMDLLNAATAKLAGRTEVFQYGETRGFPALLDYLTADYQLPNSHGAMLCTGSQQGLDLITRAYLNPGDGVAMEAPSYLGALQLFELVGASIETVEQCEDGPNLQQLEALFARGQTKLFYAVPDFHNPTGICWSLAVRKKVAALCLQYTVTLIEDAPYRELRFAGDDLPLVSSFCPDRAFVLHSFSKIAAPALRVGVVTGRDDWLAPLIALKQASDLHSSLTTQAIVLELIQMPGFRAHLDNIRHHYRQRYQVLNSALISGLDKAGIEYELPVIEGGMFVWLSLPGVDVRKLAALSLEQGVAVVPGDVFYQDSQSAPPALRLNFSHGTPEQLAAAVTRLVKAIAQIR